MFVYYTTVTYFVNNLSVFYIGESSLYESYGWQYVLMTRAWILVYAPFGLWMAAPPISIPPPPTGSGMILVISLGLLSVVWLVGVALSY